MDKLDKFDKILLAVAIVGCVLLVLGYCIPSHTCSKDSITLNGHEYTHSPNCKGHHE